MTVEVARTRTGLQVSFPYDEAAVAAMRSVPGAEFDKKKRVWRLPLDPVCMAALADAFPSLELSDGVSGWAAESGARLDALRAICSAEDAMPGSLRYENADDLYAFQRVAVRFLQHAGSALLSDEMGLGKTVTTVATIRELELSYPQGVDMWRVLIVCPNSMRHAWEAEIRKWYPTEVEVHHVKGARDFSTLPGFTIVNWEKTWRRPELAKVEWDVVVCDESHRMKNRQTKQAKAVLTLQGRHRYLLSGTPIKNEVTDLWAQLRFLEPERWTSYWKFYDRYVDFREGFFGREVVGVKNEKELAVRLASVMLGRRIGDVEIELPPLIGPKTIAVELEGEQRRAYDEMRNEFVAYINELDEDAVVAGNWLTQVLRLKQLAGSLGIFSQTSTQSAKLDALFELLEEAPPNEKFVVMTQFRGMVDEATRRLREAEVPYCELTGGSALAWAPGAAGFHHAPNRQELIDWFQKSEQPKVFVATTQTGGEGITLTAARYFVFLDLLWTPGDNEQALKRIHRVGQDRTCFIYQILAKDTVDFSAILPKLRGKKAVIDAVLNPSNGEHS